MHQPRRQLRISEQRSWSHFGSVSDRRLRRSDISPLCLCEFVDFRGNRQANGSRRKVTSQRAASRGFIKNDQHTRHGISTLACGVWVVLVPPSAMTQTAQCWRNGPDAIARTGGTVRWSRRFIMNDLSRTGQSARRTQGRCRPRRYQKASFSLAGVMFNNLAFVGAFASQRILDSDASFSDALLSNG